MEKVNVSKIIKGLIKDIDGFNPIIKFIIGEKRLTLIKNKIDHLNYLINNLNDKVINLKNENIKLTENLKSYNLSKINYNFIIKISELLKDKERLSNINHELNANLKVLQEEYNKMVLSKSKPHNRLKAEDVRFIRKSNLSVIDLSKKFNVTERTIKNVIKNKTYKNVK